MDETIKPDVVQWAAFYEHRLRLGSKPIFHLEGQSSRSLFPLATADDVTMSSLLREDHEHLQA